MEANIDLNGDIDKTTFPNWNGAEAAKYVFRIDLFSNELDADPIDSSDQSIIIGNLITLGNNGFLNEFLNGLLSNGNENYVLEAFAGDFETNSFTVLIRKNTGVFLSTDVIEIMAAEIISDADYVQTKTYLENHRHDTVPPRCDTVVLQGEFIKNASCSISGNLATVTFDTLPNSWTKNVLIWFIAGEEYATSVDIDSNAIFGAILEPFEVVVEEFVDILNFSTGVTSGDVEFIRQDLQVATNLQGYLEEMNIMRVRVAASVGQENQDVIALNSLTMNLVADDVIVDSVSINVFDDMEQVISRGYNLETADPFNEIIANHGFTISAVLFKTTPGIPLNNKTLLVDTVKTLVREDGGSFIADGFAVNDNITISLDISKTTTIVALTADTMTILLFNSFSQNEVGRYFSLEIDNGVQVDYVNDLTAVKFYEFRIPFTFTYEGDQTLFDKTVSLELVFAGTQTKIDGTIVGLSQTQSIPATVLDYEEIDGNVTAAVVQIFDSTETTNQNGKILPVADNLILATFTMADSSGSHIIEMNIEEEDSPSRFTIARSISNSLFNKIGRIGPLPPEVTVVNGTTVEGRAFLDGIEIEETRFKISSHLWRLPAQIFFNTNINASTDDFDPSVVLSAATATWILPDLVEIITNNLLVDSGDPHDLDGTDKTVTMKLPLFDNLEEIEADDDFLIDSLDLSPLFNLTSLDLNTNPDLTELLLPEANNVFPLFDVHKCGLINLDLSTLSKLSTKLDVSENALQTIILPASTQLISILSFHTNAFVGTLDISPLTSTFGQLLITNPSAIVDMPNLTAIIFPSPAAGLFFSQIVVIGMTGLTSIDLTPCLRARLDFRFSFNTSVTSITLPVSTGALSVGLFENNALANGMSTINNMQNMMEIVSCTLRFQNNAMTQVAVDQILTDLDNNSSGLFAGRSITIDGTNSAPSAGVVATQVVSLVGKGITVIHN